MSTDSDRGKEPLLICILDPVKIALIVMIEVIFIVIILALKEQFTQKWKFAKKLLVFLLMGANLEKYRITSLAHQWILCSEWVPSEWESKQLIKNITIILK